MFFPTRCVCAQHSQDCDLVYLEPVLAKHGKLPNIKKRNINTIDRLNIVHAHTIQTDKCCLLNNQQYFKLKVYFYLFHTDVVHKILEKA